MTDYKIGDRVPMPPRPRLKISPKHWVDDGRGPDVNPLPESWRDRKEREKEDSSE